MCQDLMGLVLRSRKLRPNIRKTWCGLQCVRQLGRDALDVESRDEIARSPVDHPRAELLLVPEHRLRWALEIPHHAESSESALMM